MSHMDAEIVEGLLRRMEETGVDNVHERLARALVEFLAARLPDHWSVLTNEFPFLDRGIAADLMSLVRTTKCNRTNGDFCSPDIGYLPFIRKLLAGERIDVIHDFPQER
jgi:hypothetical protein